MILKNVKTEINSFFFGLALICPILMQGQIANPNADLAYQGYLDAFLVRAKRQTYLVDGLVKRDKA